MSGIGEATLVLSLVSSIITFCDKAYEIYKAANDASGLPTKIRSAAEDIPLIRDAVKQVKDNVAARSVSEDVLQTIKPVPERCERNVEEIKTLFNKTIPAKDASKKDRLTTAEEQM